MADSNVKRSKFCCRSALMATVLAAGCGGPQMVQPVEAGAPPPAAAPGPPAQQFTAINQREPEPPPLAPLPVASRRVAVFVRDSVDGKNPVEDPVSAGIVADALVAGRPAESPDPSRPHAPRLEVVSAQVYEKALTRDAKALLTRKREVDAEILKNLAENGCDLLALGEVGTAGRDPIPVAGQVKELSHSVEASVSIVRVDDGVIVASGTGSSRRVAAIEAKREALQVATAGALRGYDERREGPVMSVTLAVEGLRAEADAAAVEKALRSTPGVIWVKDPRFQLGPDGSAASTARFEVGWNGKPEALKQVVRDLNPGFRLAGTVFEGTRWTFRAEGFSKEEKP